MAVRRECISSVATRAATRRYNIRTVHDSRFGFNPQGYVIASLIVQADLVAVSKLCKLPQDFGYESDFAMIHVV